MSDFDAPLSENPGKQEQIISLRPTLYIALGGTGMEVILRIRRRILSAVWRSTGGNPVRLDSLASFPVAQFIHFDLDQGAIVETGKAQISDPLAERVKLTDHDRLVEGFELERYCKSDDDLGKYPHIETWFPLLPKKIRELAIDPTKGAGQIRAISRLYFFDKYPRIKDKIRDKLTWLKSGLSRDRELKDLGLELDMSKFRIVVIGSVAGGTGAGSFLDMGWLAQWVAKETVSAAEVELLMFLPTGFQSANRERTEANGYASLMELETCMQTQDGANPDYVTRWDRLERLDLSAFPRPYHEIYLIDSGNLASTGVESRDLKQVYDMVADALFEDFASADFANRKRSVAVNQRQHKTLAFSPPVPSGRYGDMKLSYRQSYSSFGQAVLDTQQNLRRDIRAYLCAKGMIQAFFGVSVQNLGGNRATDKQRDEFMAKHIYLALRSFTELPVFGNRNIKVNRGELIDYQLTDELLFDRQGPLVDGVLQTVSARIEHIAADFNHGEWAIHIRQLLKQLEHDVVRDENTTADTTEDRILHKASQLSKEITSHLRDQIYIYLDDKEHGGLEFVLSLVEQVKDRLSNPHTGLADALSANAKRYAELRDALRTHECEQLLGNLEQTKGFGFASGKADQARLILGQIKQTIGDYFKFHIRMKAAERASRLLVELSQWLGERQETDERGNSRWSGLVGELQKGRSHVLMMLASVNRKIELLEEDTRKDHRTYIRIETPEEKIRLPDMKTLREWAEHVFKKDLGRSHVLFPKLGDTGERERLIGLLRGKAEEQIYISLINQQLDKKDPLVSALEIMDENTRKQRFKELLIRAMPWFEANWGKDFTPRADQFKCYIGVGDPADYEIFKDELLAQLPPGIGITAQQVSFVKTGVQGRAVCYCELSGFPLTILKGMESWRASYRKESDMIPLHNHRDPTRFIHPLAPSTAVLNQLADDFKCYLQAVFLGVLTRDTDTKIVPPGQYLYTVSPGENRRMGNERAIRLNGLPLEYSQRIIDKTTEKVAALNVRQLLALSALADYYAREVYKPRLIKDEGGVENSLKGFPSAIAEEVARNLDDSARRKGASGKEDRAHLKQLASEHLEAWTQIIENSDSDAYSWEVKEPDEDRPRLKRMVVKQFFQAGWLEQLLQGQEQSEETAEGGSLPPPPPPLTTQTYWLAINDKKYGPYPRQALQNYIAEGRADADTFGWREGMAQWQPLKHIPELAALFATTPIPPPLRGDTPAGPPPLPPKF